MSIVISRLVHNVPSHWETETRVAFAANLQGGLFYQESIQESCSWWRLLVWAMRSHLHFEHDFLILFELLSHVLHLNAFAAYIMSNYLIPWVGGPLRVQLFLRPRRMGQLVPHIHCLDLTWSLRNFGRRQDVEIIDDGKLRVDWG